MSQAVRTQQDWIRLESRALSFLVLSRVEEEQIHALFAIGFGPQCFTTPCPRDIITAIRDTMAQGKGLLEALSVAATTVPGWYWDSICCGGDDHPNLAYPGHYETMDDFRAAMFPDFTRDFKPLITRARLLSPASSP